MCDVMRPFARRAAVVAMLAAGGAAPAGACARVAALESFAATGQAPAGAVCQVFAAAEGGQGVFCAWQFALRDPAAPAFADGLWSALTACRAGTQAGPDQQVNHPDSYDLRAWVGPEGTYRVSVKDKAAQDRTVVFLRYR